MLKLILSRDTSLTTQAKVAALNAALQKALKLDKYAIYYLQITNIFADQRYLSCSYLKEQINLK